MNGIGRTRWTIANNFYGVWSGELAFHELDTAQRAALAAHTDDDLFPARMAALHASADAVTQALGQLDSLLYALDGNDVATRTFH